MNFDRILVKLDMSYFLFNVTNSTLEECVTGETVSAGMTILYIIGVLYMFLALAIVCDEYFVPILEIISDKLGLSDDVAGATLMAAGGSAPELATSLIGTFRGNSLGFSTIVGSAVFNVLFVIAACVFFSREVLKLTWFPLARDCTCYTLGLVTLSVFFSVISPGVIEIWESAILLIEYIAYVFMMKHNDRIQVYCVGKTEASEKITFRAGIIKLLIDSQSYTEGILIGSVLKIEGDVNATFDQIDEDKNGYLDKVELEKLANRLGYGLEEGELEALFTQLDTDKNGKIEKSEFCSHYMRCEGRIKSETKKIFDQIATDETIKKEDLESLMTSLKCPGANIEEIYEEIGVEAGPITYEVFMGWYEKSLFYQTKENKTKAEAEVLEGGSLSFPEDGLLNKVNWVVTIPLLLLLKYTIPGVTRPVVIRFVCAVIWIGIFSYFMVDWIEIVGNSIGIPLNVMGLTFLAAGTSVPDLLSSIIVARQGKGDMAVSSSIGSNIFDILVGLPLPWLLYGMCYGVNIVVEASNLELSLVILIAMLVFVILTIMWCNWEMNKKLGYTMFLLYIGFVAQDLARSNWC